MAVLSDQGAHCSLPECRQLDFLPFRCRHCRATFCLEHFRCEAHNCPKAANLDVRVSICPRCQQSVPLGDNPADKWRDHAKVCTGTRGAPRKRCSAPGCREVLAVSGSLRCERCGVHVCLRHRFEDAHACVPQKAIMKPASIKRPISGKLAPLTTCVAPARRARDSASARSRSIRRTATLPAKRPVPVSSRRREGTAATLCGRGVASFLASTKARKQSVGPATKIAGSPHALQNMPGVGRGSAKTPKGVFQRGSSKPQQSQAVATHMSKQPTKATSVTNTYGCKVAPTKPSVDSTYETLSSAKVSMDRLLDSHVVESVPAQAACLHSKMAVNYASSEDALLKVARKCSSIDDVPPEPLIDCNIDRSVAAQPSALQNVCSEVSVFVVRDDSGEASTSQAAETGAMHPKYWRCSTCTLDNALDVEHCNACEAPRHRKTRQWQKGLHRNNSVSVIDLSD